MPVPGIPNNPGGINGFSGPMGETEPAYGAIQQEQTLTRSAPVGSPSPASIPKKAQRRAGRSAGGLRGGPPATPPGPLGAPHAPTVNADAMQAQFWQAILNDPGSSPLARQYAMQALG